jgi:secretion/DNA translocation related TadE-like protein
VSRARRLTAADDGAGGVLVLVIAAGMLAFSIVALSIFSAIPAKARVNAAADSAAVAAAESASITSASESCSLAGQAAALNETQLVDCAVTGTEATVTVGGRILGIDFSVTSRAGVPTPPGGFANGEIPLDRLSLVSYPGVRTSPGVYLRGDAAAALLTMLQAYHEQTGDYLPVDEGYRDRAEQQRLFDLYGPPRAAIPGTSNHGEGLAVDFVNPPVVRGSEAHAWLAAHAGQFGFVPLTQPDEPWHWDYAP